MNFKKYGLLISMAIAITAGIANAQETWVCKQETTVAAFAQDYQNLTLTQRESCKTGVLQFQLLVKNKPAGAETSVTDAAEVTETAEPDAASTPVGTKLGQMILRAKPFDLMSEDGNGNIVMNSYSSLGGVSDALNGMSSESAVDSVLTIQQFDPRPAIRGVKPVKLGQLRLNNQYIVCSLRVQTEPTPTATATKTPTPSTTPAATVTATATAGAPTPTATPIAPTATPITPTATPIVPTATPIVPTATPIAPTGTPTSEPSSTPVCDPTFGPGTCVPTTPTPAPTFDVPTATPTATPICPFGPGQCSTPGPTPTFLQPTATPTATCVPPFGPDPGTCLQPARRRSKNVVESRSSH